MAPPLSPALNGQQMLAVSMQMLAVSMPAATVPGSSLILPLQGHVDALPGALGHDCPVIPYIRRFARFLADSEFKESTLASRRDGVLGSELLTASKVAFQCP